MAYHSDSTVSPSYKYKGERPPFGGICALWGPVYLQVSGGPAGDKLQLGVSMLPGYYRLQHFV